MQLATIDSSNKINLNPTIFETPFNEGLVHQVVVAHMNAARQGSKAQKNRAAVSGGGAKPFRQKGTGRARAGTIRNPIWRGGGKTFAAKPRSYQQKVNRKVYRKAMHAILAELVRQERLLVVDQLECAEPKTKILTATLTKMELQNVLIIVDEPRNNLALAARNIPHVEVITVAQVNPVNLIAHEKVLMTSAAFAKLEERLV